MRPGMFRDVLGCMGGNGWGGGWGYHTGMAGIAREYDTDHEPLNVFGNEWSICNLLSNKICFIFSFLAVCMLIAYFNYKVYFKRTKVKIHKNNRKKFIKKNILKPLVLLTIFKIVTMTIIYFCLKEKNSPGLLLLSGDIALNAGPNMNYPCSKCNKSVRVGIFCKTCNMLIHQKCEGLTNSELKNLAKIPLNEWIRFCLY